MKNTANLKIKSLATLIMSAMLIFSLVACKTDEKQESQGTSSVQQSSTQASESQKPASITDREGVELKLPQKVEKIISLAPSVTETLVNLGLAEKIVAIDDYSVGIAGLPSDLAIFNMMEPDTEQIVALKPDLIFGSSMSKTAGEDIFKPVTDTGAVMTFIPSSESIQGIKDDIIFIGQVTGVQEKAEQIVADLTKAMEDIVAKIDMPEKKPTVYFENSPAPSIYTFGAGTFLNEMITMLGAENIFADQQSWISASEEAIISKNPDIIFTNVNFVENPTDEIMSRNGFNVINAVKNKRVHYIDANASARPNENILIAFEQMAQAIYPAN